MGKVKQWSMITQEQDWNKQWELRRIELIEEYPTYSSEEIDELLEQEQSDAENEYNNEMALDHGDWSIPSEQ